jgi:uncharacterized protein YciI
LTYTASLDRVDELREDHMAWLRVQFEAGIFVASGRKEPRTGGIIIAVGNEMPAMEALVKTDPFAVAAVCEYRITNFLATTVTPALEQYRETA